MFEILFFPLRLVGWILSGVFGFLGWIFGLLFSALGSVLAFIVVACLAIGGIALCAKIIGCFARGFRNR